jgi:hypothetical protein
MNDTLILTCPRCKGDCVDGRGCTVAVEPYDRPADPFGRPRPQRVIEYQYCCNDCGHEFSLIDEL